MLKYVQDFLKGPAEDELEPQFAEEIEEGLAEGFTCSDRTLETYTQYMDAPCFTESMNWQSWKANGAKGTQARLRERFDEINAREYIPTIAPEVQEKLNRIYSEAEHEFRLLKKR